MEKSAKQIKNENLLKKARLVVSLLNEHYEEGNQAKMRAGVLRTKISKVYPISYRTLQRYIKLVKEHDLCQIN
jgi:hypothetical protein